MSLVSPKQESENPLTIEEINEKLKSINPLTIEVLNAELQVRSTVSTNHREKYYTIYQRCTLQYRVFGTFVSIKKGA